MMLATATTLVAGCDEDRAVPVAAAQPAQPHPNSVQPSGKNPISGNRTSTVGKAYDVAEDLVDNKIPEYQRRIDEELKKKP